MTDERDASPTPCFATQLSRVLLTSTAPHAIRGCSLGNSQRSFQESEGLAVAFRLQGYWL